MSADFAAIRRAEFPSLSDAIYLNSASIGPLPERTRRRLDAYSALRAAPHRMNDHDFFAELDQARAQAPVLRRGPRRGAVEGRDLEIQPRPVLLFEIRGHVRDVAERDDVVAAVHPVEVGIGR